MTDTILIVGAGVAGLHAALDVASGGANAIVVERGPVIGGKLAATMTSDTAIGDRAEGEHVPLFKALEENANIEIFTNATLDEMDGKPGNFSVSICERARFVTDACTRCKLCHAVCPVVMPNEYDAGLTFRKAIYTPMSETLPDAWVINIDDCLNTPPNYLPCNRCIEVCDDNAIFFDQALETVHQRHVGAVVLAPGFQIDDSADFTEFGYGSHADIVTSREMQRLLESPGPTGGYATKPSNEEYPESVLLVLDNLSHFGLYIVASQVHQLLEQDVEKVAVLVLSQPAKGEAFDQANTLATATGIQVSWGTTFQAIASDDNTLKVSYEDFIAKRLEEGVFDMIVLCSDVAPAAGLPALAEMAGVEVDDNGYLAGSEVNGTNVATSSPGIFIAGCASGAKNIKDSIADAKAAAAAALDQLDPRMLQSETAIAADQQRIGLPEHASPDDMRSQIEKLLYALIN